jgi:dTDP-4-dehydrorhamnose reductase
MKLVILGANGMLGHMIWEEAGKRRIDAYASVRQIPAGREQLFPRERVSIGVETEHFASVSRVLREINPDVVINCIGVVKQSHVIKDAITTIKTNSLFPHLLSRDCLNLGIRLVHLSTDCVFSGKKGNYKESDQPDPEDFYGLSKLMGEPCEENTLVIRTSMFGPELGKGHGLLEWFLSQRGTTVRGFTNAVFNGFYTRALADLILDVASQYKISGLRHLSAEPLSKYALLERIREACKLSIDTVPDGSVRIDRSLDSTLIRNELHLQIPSWNSMIDMLARDLRRDERV